MYECKNTQVIQLRVSLEELPIWVELSFVLRIINDISSNYKQIITFSKSIILNLNDYLTLKNAWLF